MNHSGDHTYIQTAPTALAGNTLLQRLGRLPFSGEEWNIGLVHQPISTFAGSKFARDIQWLPRASEGKSIADPFGVVWHGRTFIFCEEFDARSPGQIVCFELPIASTLERKVVFRLSIHISHPYVFQHDGEIYCIPETYQAREIAIYRAEEFPTEWVKETTIVPGVAGLDATPFQYEGKWWLTYTDEERGASDNLLIWHSDDLFGPWKPHSGNPVKLGARSSRPAGTPFIHEGHLYRPAQDCSITYGGRIIINRVLTLSPSKFKEEEVAVIEPLRNGPYPHGIHTVSAIGNMTLVDGKRMKFMNVAISRLRQYVKSAGAHP